MAELVIKVPNAAVMQIKAENVSKSCVRAYKGSPTRVELQIRVEAGKRKRALFAHASLTKVQCIELAAHLMQEASRCHDEVDVRAAMRKEAQA